MATYEQLITFSEALKTVHDSYKTMKSITNHVEKEIKEREKYHDKNGNNIQCIETQLFSIINSPDVDGFRFLYSITFDTNTDPKKTKGLIKDVKFSDMIKIK